MKHTNAKEREHAIACAQLSNLAIATASALGSATQLLGEHAWHAEQFDHLQQIGEAARQLAALVAPLAFKPEAFLENLVTSDKPRTP